MSQPTQASGVFGRYNNGAPGRVEHHFWANHGVDAVEWDNLTNEDIIVLVTQRVVVAVVLQDTTHQHQFATVDEVDIIKRLFVELNNHNKAHDLHFNIHYCFPLILYDGQYCRSNRTMMIETHLSQIAPSSSSYFSVAHEGRDGHERIVTAKSWGLDGDHPVVLGAYRLPTSVGEGSCSYTGPVFDSSLVG
jgi:hypothetical protein